MQIILPMTNRGFGSHERLKHRSENGPE